MDVGINITDEEIECLSELEGWTFDESRKNILKSMKTLDVQACPGSGKTTLIAAKLILLSQKWSNCSRGICVLSHTNVAKNEIIKCLNNSNILNAQRLLKYPHFIGTIQEFVDRFISLPYCRDRGHSVQFLEGNDGYREVLNSGCDLNDICRSLYRALGKPQYDEIKDALGSLYWLNENRDLAFKWKNGIKEYKHNPNATIYPKLQALKSAIQSNGYFQYSDMYHFANSVFKNSPAMSEFLSNRFPVVLIDEMQDTQLHQDEVLHKAFCSGEYQAIVQRFGDPDQAIFGGGADIPNKSYNDKTDIDFVINTSHRFNNNIATQIKCLSLNQVDLASERSVNDSNGASDGEFQNTIIAYEINAAHTVVPKFADIVSRQFSDTAKSENELKIKVIGAVGKPIENKETHVRIESYWPEYLKDQSQSSFKPTSLLSAVQHCNATNDRDWASNYKIMMSSVIKLLSILNQRHTVSSLKDELNSAGSKKWKELRSLILAALLWPEIIEKNWKTWNSKILGVLGCDQNTLNNGASVYLSSTKNASLKNNGGPAKELQHDVVSIGSNCLKYKDEFVIEIATIHGVKGETHDATLVLPTKNHIVDVPSILPYFTGDLPSTSVPNNKLRDKPNHKAKIPQNKQFLKQLYVACSRPKSLLCVAIDKEVLSDEDTKKLASNGWCVVNATD